MKPSAIRLHLTSFGPFLDVVDNPSQRIGEVLEKRWRSAPEGSSRLTLVDHRTLEVSVDAVAEYFDTNGGPLAATIAASHDGPTPNDDVVDLLVHLGVHRGAHGEIRVELQGVNDLHCPQGDFKGRMVVHRPIIVADTGSSTPPQWKAEASFDDAQSGPAAFESLWCAIPAPTVEEAIELVGSAQFAQPTVVDGEGSDELLRHKVSMVSSTDAGRYLCNYSYCRSLHYTGHVCRQSLQSAPQRTFSLFIHVLDPSRSGGDGGTSELYNPTIEAQADCIFRFLERVAATL